jgi:hypothetical protein
MSTPGQAPLPMFVPRRAPRCPLAVPVRVNLQRAGTAYSMTGHAVNLGEGGIAISLADEVGVSDSVGVEFLLPELGLGLEARAVVRYRVASHSGLEFDGLTRHQQAAIREWTRQRQSKPSFERRSLVSPQLRHLVWPIIVVVALLGLIAWWRWERARKGLKNQTQHSSAQVGRLQTQLLAYLPATRLDEMLLL